MRSSSQVGHGLDTIAGVDTTVVGMGPCKELLLSQTIAAVCVLVDWFVLRGLTMLCCRW